MFAHELVYRWRPQVLSLKSSVLGKIRCFNSERRQSRVSNSTAKSTQSTLSMGENSSPLALQAWTPVRPTPRLQALYSPTSSSKSSGHITSLPSTPHGPFWVQPSNLDCRPPCPCSSTSTVAAKYPSSKNPSRTGLVPLLFPLVFVGARSVRPLVPCLHRRTWEPSPSSPRLTSAPSRPRGSVTLPYRRAYRPTPFALAICWVWATRRRSSAGPEKSSVRGCVYKGRRRRVSLFFFFFFFSKVQDA